MFKISSLKKTIVHLRHCTKFTILIALALILIIAIISLFYKPIYSVTLNGEMIGYSADKNALQKRINEYIKNGTGENVAFVEIDELPQYKLCLLKKDIVANDEEIYEKVIARGNSIL